MKKNVFMCFIVAAFAMIAMSFTTKVDEPINGQAQPKSTPLIVSTDANGEIVGVENAFLTTGNIEGWMIKDLSGLTNIRNRPSGKVCMKLKAYTVYAIYTNGRNGGWLRISSIYNETEDYEVRLHGSTTGYWIARSILKPYED